MRLIFLLLSLSFVTWGCTSRSDKGDPLFRLMPSRHTGITFSNVINQNDSQNILQYMYFYNGGGVGILDVDNDGLMDVFFSGNMVSSKLYLNKGNLQFEDISSTSNIATTGWCTGVAVVDINNDGYTDIYVSRAGSGDLRNRGNLLFINNGDKTFTESASAYGIADSGYNTHAAFFDYDKDGDLDLYVLSHDHAPKKVNNIEEIKENGEAGNTDKLYRNNGNHGAGHPTFTNVSREAGISIEGYGLGVAVNDINADGWPDIYVANDFLSSDLLYINNRDGTFTNRIGEYIKHDSYNGMGTDVADYNNDGLPDIVVMDMLPEKNFRQKMMSGSMNNEKFKLMVDVGYRPQYMRNTLQLNNGNGHFSEIGQLAGVDKTDWSWAPLFADFDNDGYKDLFITNGYLKDITDKDFIIFGQNKTVLQDAKSADSILLALIDKQKGVKIPNYVFRNNRDLTFVNELNWGLAKPSYSNGAAFADLDNDGDLDMVVNNINDEAFIYRNDCQKLTHRRYLQLALVGDSSNVQGLGAKVTLRYDGNIQYYEHTLYRGYQSSVTNLLHFGLDSVAQVDTLEILWPDNTVEILSNVQANQRLVINKENALHAPSERVGKTASYFEEVSGSLGINFLHNENDFSDLTTELLLPHDYSRMGPAMAAADIDGNGLEDFIIGGASGHAATIYLQLRSGKFAKKLFADGVEYEDMGLLLFDADGDGDADLYIVSGGTNFSPESPLYNDRFYRNDGKGNFTRDASAIPATAGSGSCVTAADYDRDGDLDLFVGRRYSPGDYPQSPSSYILENNSGKFTDATANICAPLKDIGMVTSALWTDFDNDNQIDLIVAGEWMPVKFFKNANGKLTDVTSESSIDSSEGWWNSIAGGDFDNDGDVDYILGNLGLNTPFQASPAEPITLVTADIDESGKAYSLLTWNSDGVSYPWASRDVMLKQVPRLGKKFFSHANYAKATVADIVSPKASKYGVLKSVWHASSYLQNLGGGKFSLKPLPTRAQFAPVNGIVIRDVDFDGNLDCVLSGNFFSPDVSIGRYDASLGLMLKGDGRGNFTDVPAQQSGFLIDKDSRSLITLYSGQGRVLIAGASNSDSLRIFAQKLPPGVSRYKLSATDIGGRISTADGRKRKLEFYYGSGYLSQSARTIEVSDAASAIEVYDSRGNARKIGHQNIATK